MGEVSSALPPPATRIYVGGLSEGVTAAEVEKTFSSLGQVCGVELVRTKGRSFAYMDFQPSSEKSLAKLFATYNGCTWKGGKLRLGKAKEHYLDRLKREWVEDAEPVSNPAVDLIVEKKPCSSKQAEVLNLENMQLQIFFPKLRKVKSLPFKGTGKHKYSFQRIEVPSSLPIHFCDCEEHCVSSETADKKNPSVAFVVHEKELSIMNSVMKKLFEKHENEKLSNGMMAVDAEPNNMDSSADEAESEEVEDQSADADNLVTNIGKGGSDKMLDLMLIQQRGEQSVGQVKKSKKVHGFKDGQSPKKVDTIGRSDGPKRTCDIKLNGEAQSSLAAKLLVTGLVTPSLKSKENSTGLYIQERDILTEPITAESQNELGPSSIHSTKGQLWVQKSSWKELVGGAGENSFSMSEVLPGLIPTSPKLPILNHSSTARSAAPKRRKIRSEGEHSRSSHVVQNNPAEDAVLPPHAKTLVKADVMQVSPDGERLGTPPPVSADRDSVEVLLTPSLHSKESPSAVSQEMEFLAEPKTAESQNDPSAGNSQVTKGQSWVQKSSWKELVGGVGDNSFCLSHVLPGISIAPCKSPVSISATSVGPVAPKKRKVLSEGDGSRSSQVIQNSPVENAVPPAHAEALVNRDMTQTYPDREQKEEPQRNSEPEPRRTVPKITISEVCPFMRSSDSEKQWGKAKAALTGYLNNKKKKSREADSSETSKGMRPYQL